jgi:hypothetical protein
MQQALLRYYGNAVKDLTCHSIMYLYNKKCWFGSHYFVQCPT